MARLRACVNELEKAYSRHKRAIATLAVASDTAPRNMLLFYAVECGLKAMYLRFNQVPPLRAIPEVMNTHDISSLVKELRIAAAPLTPNFRRRANNALHHPTDQAHTAWRYGIDIEVADETKLVQGLTALSTRIERDLLL